MRNLRRAIGVGLVSGVVVVSMAAASGSALSVDGGTLQVFTVTAGPAPRELLVLPKCRPLTVPCPDDESVGGSPSPSLTESPQATSPPNGTGGGTAPGDPGGDPAADRASLLQPCPDRAECVIYMTRAGDNLVSIVRYFDVAMSETQTLNPWLETVPHLPVGVDLRLPWPEWLAGPSGSMLPEPTPTESSPEPGDPSPDPTPGDPSPPADQPTPTPEPTPETTPDPTASPTPTESPDWTAPPASDLPASPSPPAP